MFGWLVAAVATTVTTVVIAAGTAIAYNLGNKSYSGSVEERVDVEKETREYKEKLKEASERAEKRALDDCMAIFENLSSELRRNSDFTGVCDWVDREKHTVEKNLIGVFSRYVDRKMSENDESFDEVLRMQPGTAKTTAIKSRIDSILEEADHAFQKRLFKEVTKLNEELCTRMDKIVAERAAEAEETEETMRALAEDQSENEKAASKAEADYISAENANQCIFATLPTADMSVKK